MCAKMLPRPNFLLTQVPASISYSSPADKFTNKPQRCNDFHKLRGFSPNNGDVKCNHPGCNFMASPDVLILHQKVSHFKLHTKNSGLVVDSPEEIAKWKEERRARFPKLDGSNLSTGREQHHQQKYKAHPRQFNKHNNNNRYQYSNVHKRSDFNNRGYNRNSQFHQRSYNMQPRNSHQAILKKPMSPVSHKDRTVTFDGAPPCKISASNSLNLLACYESDEEEEASESSLIKTAINDSPTEVNSKSVHEQTIYDLVSDLVQKVEVNLKKRETIPTVKENPKPRRRPFIANKYLSYSKLTLFQKLMLQDIRQVKEDFIECLRYIKDNNYLETSV